MALQCCVSFLRELSRVPLRGEGSCGGGGTLTLMGDRVAKHEVRLVKGVAHEVTPRD